MNIDLHNHIFGDRKPKKLDEINVYTLINLPTFKSFFEEELTPEQKEEMRKSLAKYYSADKIWSINSLIRDYNRTLVELNLIEPELEAESKNTGILNRLRLNIFNSNKSKSKGGKRKQKSKRKSLKKNRKQTKKRKGRR